MNKEQPAFKASKKSAKALLRMWVRDIVDQAPGGVTTVMDIKKKVWEFHEDDLKAAGDLFFTWQDQVPWCVTELRNKGVIERPRPTDGRGAGIVRLTT